jgi:hypothetical protein
VNSKYQEDPAAAFMLARTSAATTLDTRAEQLTTERTLTLHRRQRLN